MLERCIALEPRFVQAYLELLFQVRLHEQDKTSEEDKRWIFHKLLDLEPNNWEHYLLYGSWLKSRGEFFKVLPCF